MATVTVITYLAQYDGKTFITNDEDIYLEWLADIAIAMAREAEQDELPAIPW